MTFRPNQIDHSGLVWPTPSSCARPADRTLPSLPARPTLSAKPVDRAMNELLSFDWLKINKLSAFQVF